MKNILIILVIVIGAGLTFYFFTNSGKENLNNDQKDNVATTQISDARKTFQVEVDVPEGWEAVEGSVLDIQYLKNTASFMIKTESFSTTDLSEVANQAISIFQGAFDNVSLVEEVSDVKIAGYDAKEFTFTAQVSSLSMKYRYIYTIVDGQVYAITFADMESTFDDLNDDFQSIINSIRFVEE